jgi:hypothetical protein
MGDRYSYLEDKKSGKKSNLLFKAYIRRNPVQLIINKNLYSEADLVAETMGYYGLAHLFLYMLTLWFKRAHYMTSILEKLFLMKKEENPS